MEVSGYLLALAAVTPQNTTQYSSYCRLSEPRDGLVPIEKSKTLGPWRESNPDYCAIQLVVCSSSLSSSDANNTWNDTANLSHVLAKHKRTLPFKFCPGVPLVAATLHTAYRSQSYVGTAVVHCFRLRFWENTRGCSAYLAFPEGIKRGR